ncbi:MAG: DNA cytosine methyltransferase [Dehalogenimonas sp.]
MFYNSRVVDRKASKLELALVCPKPRAVELFSGCGGMTLGLKLAGFKVLGAIEKDKTAAKTYKKNHPEVKLIRKDITKVGARRFMESLGLTRGQLDLLAACPPCQGFSSIRTHNGSKDVKDTRNDLVFEVLRFARVFKPKTIMFENTPGLAEDWRMNELWVKLLALGYKGKYLVRDAAEFGVPQRRKRLILLAGMSRNIKLPRRSFKSRTVRQTIGTLSVAGESGDLLHDMPEKRSNRIRLLIGNIPKNGGSRLSLGEENQLACHKKCDGFKDVYGRLAWDKVAPTITSGCTNPSKGRFIHPQEDRALTAREASLLQTFPPTYWFPVEKGKCAISCMIGNAIPPEFVRRHAKAIINCLRREELDGR